MGEIFCLVLLRVINGNNWVIDSIRQWIILHTVYKKGGGIDEGYLKNTAF